MSDSGGVYLAGDMCGSIVGLAIRPGTPISTINQHLRAHILFRWGRVGRITGPAHTGPGRERELIGAIISIASIRGIVGAGFTGADRGQG